MPKPSAVPDFTIGFLVHATVPLLERTIPTTIKTLTAGSKRTFDLVLAIDGAERAPVDELLGLAGRWGFDEVRLRWRSRHVSGGDPSNNGHANWLPGKGRYFIGIDGDVVAFRTGDGDVLDLLAACFDACPGLALATRIDDHDCWQWPLVEVAPPMAPGIRSVNRVASHFLVYDLPRATDVMWSAGGPPADRFHDSPESWFNYEDWLSQTFAAPTGPGIGYLDHLPIAVFHCDEKVAPGASMYSRDLDVRLRVFEQRRAECAHVRGA
ncbi:hypothetical protein [Rhizomonospora bruguierae]|uniref:hypothetical protein n=1 Tax=Rhizomonospora bruguierae TaxID=1581705 RepID=UPI001BCF3C15|nr:hypothetical protein [Micromonospora sp. NBRC 107566]